MKIRSDNAVALQTLSASPSSLSALSQLQPMVLPPTEAIHQRDLFFSMRSVRARIESYLKTREDALFTPSLSQPQYLAFMFSPKSVLDADHFILAFWDELAQQQAAQEKTESPFMKVALAIQAKKQEEETNVFNEVLLPAIGDEQEDASEDDAQEESSEKEQSEPEMESHPDILPDTMADTLLSPELTYIAVEEQEPFVSCAVANQDSAKPCPHRLSTFHIRWLAVNVKARIPMPLQVMASSDERLSEQDVKEVGFKRMRYAYDPDSLECYPEDIFPHKKIEKAQYATHGLLQTLGKLIPAKNPLRLSIDDDATVWLGTRFKWECGSYYKDGQGNYLQMYDLIRLPNGTLGVVQVEEALNKVPFVSYENPFSKKLLKDAMVAAVEKQEGKGYLLAG